MNSNAPRDSGPLALKSNEGRSPDAEAPPWLLPLHEAMLIANTHRVRVGAVQAIAKAAHKELAAENERLRAFVRSIADSRNTYGWGPEADAAIEAARVALEPNGPVEPDTTAKESNDEHNRSRRAVGARLDRGVR